MQWGLRQWIWIVSNVLLDSYIHWIHYVNLFKSSFFIHSWNILIVFISWVIYDFLIYQSKIDTHFFVCNKKLFDLTQFKKEEKFISCPIRKFIIAYKKWVPKKFLNYIYFNTCMYECVTYLVSMQLRLLYEINNYRGGQIRPLRVP